MGFAALAWTAAPETPHPAHSSQSCPQADFRGTEISAWPGSKIRSTVAICVMIPSKLSPPPGRHPSASGPSSSGVPSSCGGSSPPSRMVTWI